MTALDIRLARFDDRHELSRIQREASLAGYPADVAEQLATRPELFEMDLEMIALDRVFVATRHGLIIGFAVIVPHEDDAAELEGLFVAPPYWREGVGSALVAKIVREAEAWGAKTLRVIANPFAVAFYTANGFVEIGQQTMQMGPPAPAMIRPLHPA